MKITKKEVINELKNILDNYYNDIYHWKILNVNIDKSDFFYYYEAYVLSRGNGCIYLVRKDRIDESVLMDLMTPCKDLCTIELKTYLR